MFSQNIKLCILLNKIDEVTMLLILQIPNNVQIFWLWGNSIIVVRTFNKDN